jgi:hypothetical protein
MHGRRQAPGIFPRTSDPRSPVFGLFVPKVFGQIFSGARSGCQISAVFVLEIDICLIIAINRNKFEKKNIPTCYSELHGPLRILSEPKNIWIRLILPAPTSYSSSSTVSELSCRLYNLPQEAVCVAKTLDRGATWTKWSSKLLSGRENLEAGTHVVYVRRLIQRSAMGRVFVRAGDRALASDWVENVPSRSELAPSARSFYPALDWTSWGICQGPETPM